MINKIIKFRLYIKRWMREDIQMHKVIYIYG